MKKKGSVPIGAYSEIYIERAQHLTAGKLGESVLDRYIWTKYYKTKTPDTAVNKAAPPANNAAHLLYFVAFVIHGIGSSAFQSSVSGTFTFAARNQKTADTIVAMIAAHCEIS